MALNDTSITVKINLKNMIFLVKIIIFIILLDYFLYSAT